MKKGILLGQLAFMLFLAACLKTQDNKRSVAGENKDDQLAPLSATSNQYLGQTCGFSTAHN